MDDSWNKKLLAFLNGLARRKYFREDISDDLLKEQVLGGVDEEGKSSNFTKKLNWWSA